MQDETNAVGQTAQPEVAPQNGGAPAQPDAAPQTADMQTPPKTAPQAPAAPAVTPGAPQTFDPDDAARAPDSIGAALPETGVRVQEHAGFTVREILRDDAKSLADPARES